MATACGRSAPPGDARGTAGARNLLLVTIDTLRADRVGAYGYQAARTPAIDALSARGMRFAHAYSAAPITLPSHATIMTGRYPPGHGARHNGMQVDLENPDPGGHVRPRRLLHRRLHRRVPARQALRIEPGLPDLQRSHAGRRPRSPGQRTARARRRGRSDRVAERAPCRALLPLGPLLRTACAIRQPRPTRGPPPIAMTTMWRKRIGRYRASSRPWGTRRRRR